MHEILILPACEADKMIRSVRGFFFQHFYTLRRQTCSARTECKNSHGNLHVVGLLRPLAWWPVVLEELRGAAIRKEL